MIDFPTRCRNTLDQIYTNVQEYYKPPNRNSPFGLSDHVTITAFPKSRDRSTVQSKKIKMRLKRSSDIASLGRFFMTIPWDSVLVDAQSCAEKLSVLTDIIKFGLDTIMTHQDPSKFIKQASLGSMQI